MRITCSSAAGRAAARALLVAGAAVLLGACSDAPRSISSGLSPSPSTPATSEASPTTPSAAPAAGDTASASPAPGVATAPGMPVAVRTGDLSCRAAGRRYTVDALARPEPTGGGRAAIVLRYCGAGSQPLEANPPVTVLGPGGTALPVTVRYQPVEAERLTAITGNGPMCLVLEWPAAAKGTGPTSAGVRIGPASGRSAFTVDLRASFGASPVLTASQWVASSGGPGSCLGT